jgi:predicted nucleic acid-binding protein
MTLAVIDASLIVELLVAGSSGQIDLTGSYESLNAPVHVDIECVNALRGNFLGGLIEPVDFATAALLVAEMPITRYPIGPLVPRIVTLASNATAYDAAYIALAEALDADLLTTDARLAGIPGVTCHVRVL